MINIFFYIPFLFTKIIVGLVLLLTPNLKLRLNNKTSYWDYRLYLVELREKDSSTYWAFLVLPNLMWILPAIVLLLGVE